MDTFWNEARKRVIDAIAQEGFGVLSEIVMQKTLKKIGVEWPGYKILGACNPKFVHKTLQSEPHIGVQCYIAPTEG